MLYAGWTGKRCETLDLLPAQLLAGYRHTEAGRNISSWGAPVLRHPKTGVYHAWPAEMTHFCGINAWERNSQVVHATSADPAGTYARQGVVWPVFASEPSVALGSKGEAVMWPLRIIRGRSRRAARSARLAAQMARLSLLATQITREGRPSRHTSAGRQMRSGVSGASRW